MTLGYNGNWEEEDDLLGTGMRERYLLEIGKLDPFGYSYEGNLG